MFKLRQYRERIQYIHRAMYVWVEREFTSKQKNVLVGLIILLMTISQTAVTIYLPSMPSMAHALKTDNIHIQFSLTFYLIGYGCSQFIYGPLSDIYGRRLIVLWGLTIFVLASFICMLSPTVDVFLFARILQGVGIGCGDTMGRAILCDRFESQAFVKAASYIGMAATITPLIAPILGGYLQLWFNWHANFVFLFLYGVVNLCIMFFYLPETKPFNVQSVTTMSSIVNSYRFVLRNRIFLGFFIPGLVSFVGEMLYSMMAPFLIQEKLGWSPVSFGWLSTLIVVGLLIGTLIANRMAHRVSHYKMVYYGMCTLICAGICMLLPSLFHYLSVVTIMLPMFIFMIGVGVTYPNTNMGALTPFTAMAGIAGALQGGLQMLIGGFVGVMIGKFNAESQFALAFALMLISSVGLIAFVGLLRTARTSQ